MEETAYELGKSLTCDRNSKKKIVAGASIRERSVVQDLLEGHLISHLVKEVRSEGQADTRSCWVLYGKVRSLHFILCPKQGQDPFYVVRKLLLLQHGEEVEERRQD